MKVFYMHIYTGTHARSTHTHKHMHTLTHRVFGGFETPLSEGGCSTFALDWLNETQDESKVLFLSAIHTNSNEILLRFFIVDDVIDLVCYQTIPSVL